MPFMTKLPSFCKYKLAPPLCVLVCQTSELGSSKSSSGSIKSGVLVCSATSSALLLASTGILPPLSLAPTTPVSMSVIRSWKDSKPVLSLKPIRSAKKLYIFLIEFGLFHGVTILTSIILYLKNKRKNKI